MFGNNALESAGFVASLLIGTGAVAFFVRYGTRLALLERLIETSQLITLHPRLSLVESAVQEIKSSLIDLKHLPKISAQLDGLGMALQLMVPRSEHEKVWKSNDQRFEHIEKEIDRLAPPVTKHDSPGA